MFNKKFNMFPIQQVNNYIELLSVYEFCFNMGREIAATYCHDFSGNTCSKKSNLKRILDNKKEIL